MFLGNALQGDAVVSQYVLVVFQVLPDLGQLGILQQRLELLENLVTIQLFGGAHVVVAQGNVSGFARVDREGDTHYFSVDIAKAGGFRVEGKQIGRFQALQPLIQLLLVGDDAVVFFTGLLFGFVFSGLGVAGGCSLSLLQFGNPGAELIFLEQFEQLLVILLPKLQVFQAKIQFHVRADGGQFGDSGAVFPWPRAGIPRSCP